VIIVNAAPLHCGWDQCEVGLLLAAAVLEQEGLTAQGKKAALTLLTAAHDLDVQVIVPSGAYLPLQMAASPGARQ
jgi:hypothetical protein